MNCMMRTAQRFASVAGATARGYALHAPPVCPRPSTGNKRRIIVVKSSTAEAVEQRKPLQLERRTYSGRVADCEALNNSWALREVLQGSSHSSMDMSFGSKALWLYGPCKIDGAATITSLNGFLHIVLNAGAVLTFQQQDRCLEHVQAVMSDANGSMTCILPATHVAVCGQLTLPASTPSLTPMPKHPCLKVLNCRNMAQGECFTLGEGGHLEWPVNISAPWCPTCPVAAGCGAK